MSRAPRAGGVADVLSGRGVLRTFAGVLVGRFAYGLLPLCFLFLVRQSGGSFRLAATASALWGVATLAMPFQSRLVDAYGQRRVLPAFTSAHVLVLLAGPALAASGAGGAWWCAYGLALGLTGPAFGPAMRAQWREVAGDSPSRLRVAYSSDAVAEEVVFLAGPLAAAGVLAAGSAATGLVVAAACQVVGCLALCLSPYAPPGAGHGHRRTVRASGTASGAVRLLPLLASTGLYGAAGAAVFVGVAAVADGRGRPEWAGLVETAVALGAVVGTAAWARWGRDGSWRRALAALLLGWAAVLLVAALAVPAMGWLGWWLALGAAVSAPVYVVAFGAADTLVEAYRRTEASTWVTTSGNLGSSLGTAAGGLLVGLGGGAPFVAGAVCAAVAALGAGAGGRTHRR